MPPLLVGVIAPLIVLPLFVRFLGGRWLFHRMRSALPLVGKLWMWTSQREFAAALGSFLGHRLPTVDAVQYTGDVLSDRSMSACAGGYLLDWSRAKRWEVAWSSRSISTAR